MIFCFCKYQYFEDKSYLPAQADQSSPRNRAPVEWVGGSFKNFGTFLAFKIKTPSEMNVAALRFKSIGWMKWNGLWVGWVIEQLTLLIISVSLLNISLSYYCVKKITMTVFGWVVSAKIVLLCMYVCMYYYVLFNKEVFSPGQSAFSSALLLLALLPW